MTSYMIRLWASRSELENGQYKTLSKYYEIRCVVVSMSHMIISFIVLIRQGGRIIKKNVITQKIKLLLTLYTRFVLKNFEQLFTTPNSWSCSITNTIT